MLDMEKQKTVTCLNMFYIVNNKKIYHHSYSSTAPMSVVGPSFGIHERFKHLDNVCYICIPVSGLMLDLITYSYKQLTNNNFKKFKENKRNYLKQIKRKGNEILFYE